VAAALAWTGTAWPASAEAAPAPADAAAEAAAAPVDAAEAAADEPTNPWDPPANAPDPPAGFPCGTSPNGSILHTWTWSEQVELNLYHRHTWRANCEQVYREWRYWYRGYDETDPRTVCAAPGAVWYEGFRAIPWYHDPVGELTTALRSYLPCTAEEPEPPWVDVTGTVSAPINTDGEERPLAGARYELWYHGRDGTDGVEQWRPVLDDVDPQTGEPAGEPVTGYLDPDGGYHLRFVYPHRYVLPGGGTWAGCPEPDEPTEFMDSYACEDQNLALRVYPRDEGDSVVVLWGDEPEPTAAGSIGLGRFFERPAGEEHVLGSQTAMAYRAARNAIDLVGRPALGATRILLDPDRQGPAQFVTTGYIVANPADAGTSTMEHELGHQYYFRSLNPLLPACGDHTFDRPSSPACALSEGFAHFFASLAERIPVKVRRDDVIDLDTPAGCHAGSAVECRVTAALLDLVDNTTDRANGFTDQATVPLSAVLSVFANYRPESIDAFWAGWKHYHSGSPKPRDLQVMYQNTLVYEALEDNGSPVVSMAGRWDKQVCEPCVGGSFERSDPAAGKAGVSWNIDHAVTGEAGPYDVWLHLPAGSVAYDAHATVMVKVVGGWDEVKLDLAGADGGWLQLPATYFGVFVMDPAETNEVKLVQGDNERALVVDAILVDRHLG
jgi:hypothetical protein